MHLFVEGGRATFSSFVKSGLVDKLAVFIAPMVLGDGDGLGSLGNLDVKGLDRCYRFSLDQVDHVGGDVLLILYPER
jgi:diaminohydroxyphosphoribosylaminopyrimidine deaminase/5-amino-6-(5-phosphoribosylamino)uracil reductase